jgi:hypothetical protein
VLAPVMAKTQTLTSSTLRTRANAKGPLRPTKLTRWHGWPPNWASSHRKIDNGWLSCWSCAKAKVQGAPGRDAAEGATASGSRMIVASLKAEAMSVHRGAITPASCRRLGVAPEMVTRTPSVITDGKTTSVPGDKHSLHHHTGKRRSDADVQRVRPRWAP